MLPAPVAPVVARRAPARSRRVRFVILAASIALLLSACSTSGPKNFDDKALIDNFARSCKDANPQTKDLPDNVQFCDCVYAEIRTTYSFDEFKTLDANLRDAFKNKDTAPKTAADLTKVDARYAGVVGECRIAGPSPSSNASTTTLATTTTTK